MNDKLRRYIEGLFEDVPQSKSMIELKEEMLQNLVEKYEDLIQEGRGEDDAYNIAVAGIGDINGLIDDMKKSSVSVSVDMNVARQKSAMLVSIAVMCYMLSIVPILMSFNFNIELFTGVIGFFIFIALGTGLLIYNAMSKPKPIMDSSTMVNEFREWQIDKSQKKSTRISVSVALWALLIALYFVVSFITYSWEVTWIIFIIGIAIEALINIFTAIKK